MLVIMVVEGKGKGREDSIRAVVWWRWCFWWQINSGTVEIKQVYNWWGVHGED